MSYQVKDPPCLASFVFVPRTVDKCFSYLSFDHAIGQFSPRMWGCTNAMIYAWNILVDMSYPLLACVLDIQPILLRLLQQSLAGKRN